MTGEDIRESGKEAIFKPFGISTGMDCESISRFESLIRKKAFLDRVFTGEEVSYCLARRNPAKHFAGRFCAKEACMKALGTGLSEGIRWRDIEIINREKGAPELILSGRALALMGGDGEKEKKIFLSISYGAGLAAAVVVIE